MNSTLAVSRKKIAARRISVILDESPDIIGRPAINTLISFYDFLSNRKTVLPWTQALLSLVIVQQQL